MHVSYPTGRMRWGGPDTDGAAGLKVRALGFFINFLKTRVVSPITIRCIQHVPIGFEVFCSTMEAHEQEVSVQQKYYSLLANPQGGMSNRHILP